MNHNKTNNKNELFKQNKPDTSFLEAKNRARVAIQVVLEQDLRERVKNMNDDEISYFIKRDRFVRDCYNDDV